MDDTSPEAHRRYGELLRQRTPAERLAIAMTLSQAVRQLTIAGIQSAHPGASERELDIRLAARLYGPAVARRIYGVTPDDL